MLLEYFHQPHSITLAILLTMPHRYLTLLRPARPARQVNRDANRPPNVVLRYLQNQVLPVL